MYEKKDYTHLIGLEGFSDALLTNHFGLYEGYVANTNKVLEVLKTTTAGTPEHSEVCRRFGWEFNGMRLHELYFGNMTKESGELNDESGIVEKLIADWGSLEEWEADFKAVGAMRGIGWVVLAYDKEGGALFNVWVNEHDVGFLAGAVPLLVMDVFEHAFVLDYGMKRAEYIESFGKAVDWREVEKRFDLVRG